MTYPITKEDYMENREKRVTVVAFQTDGNNEPVRRVMTYGNIDMLTAVDEVRKHQEKGRVCLILSNEERDQIDGCPRNPDPYFEVARGDA